MNLKDITPLVLTFNEEPNLRRCLERLRWAQRVVVLDSGSTDGTAAIAAEFANVEFFTRPFDDHTRQWNHGLDLTKTPWVLALDSDYVIGHGFEEELSALAEDAACAAYFASFRYLIFGRPLRSCLYPPRAVLFRRERCHYDRDGHTQLLNIKGETKTLKTQIDHDDRKPLSRWLASQDKYAVLEVAKLLDPASSSPVRLQDRARRWIVVAPWLTLAYTLVVKRAMLDGWPGFYYVIQRTLAELILSLRLIEARLNHMR